MRRRRPGPEARLPAAPARAAYSQAIVEAYYLQRTRFRSIIERKLRQRQFTEEGTWRSARGTCGEYRCR